MMDQTCRLCGGTGQPLRNSHILPEFLYADVYDEKHRFLALDAEEDTRRFEQKGLREHLLCDSCEGTLNRWETPSKLVVDRIPRVATADIHDIPDVDYPSFRLFQLSMFWRASIASKLMFEGFTLGPHEDRILDLLLRQDPAKPECYPTMIMVPASDSPLFRVISPPLTVKRGGHRIYYWLAGGLIWTLVTSSHTTRDAKALPLHRPGETLRVVSAGVGGDHLAEVFRETLTDLAHRIEDARAERGM